MSKYVVLALAVLIFPAAAVRACSGDEVARRAAQTEELRERLAKSEYVVRKGELTRRPQADADAARPTPLSRDEEFQLVKKSLEAARARLTVPDGSGLVILDAKEHYEVVIGDAPAAEPAGPEYAAKVFVNKETLAVSRVLVNEMKNADQEAARKVAQFRDLSERLAKSEYVVERGELTRRPDGVAVNSTPLAEDEEFQVMKKGFEAAKAKLTIPEGSGVVVLEGEEYYEVIIGTPLPAGVRGPDYAAKVMLDKKKLTVVQLLAGG